MCVYILEENDGSKDWTQLEFDPRFAPDCDNPSYRRNEPDRQKFFVKVPLNQLWGWCVKNECKVDGFVLETARYLGKLHCVRDVALYMRTTTDKIWEVIEELLRADVIVRVE